jgi:threonyl-tRNA synthetase
MQMNDAHIYCSEEQFEDEFMGVVALYQEYFRIFGIEKYVMQFSTHHKNGLGKKYVDDEPLWQKTEEMVRRTMKNGGIPFVEVHDEAAFYGPKIDVQIWSAIGREFTLATNQVDFAQPARCNLSFINRQGDAEIPICLHRAPLSTHERMIGFLIEHYAGKFPVWLAPEHARVIPIGDSHNEYAERIVQELKSANLRVSADLSNERMNAKIRQAQLMQVPYMLVVGDREMENNSVSMRKRDGTRENGVPTEQFATSVRDRIASRSAEL